MYIAELDDVDLEISNTIKEVEKYRNVHWCKSVNDIVDELLGLVIVLKGHRNECEQPK